LRSLFAELWSILIGLDWVQADAPVLKSGAGGGFMGPGHLAVALAAKPVAPKAPLWVYLVASETLDLLSFLFLAIGLEKPATSTVDITHGVRFIVPGSIPWSHGLFMSLFSSGLAALLAWLVWRDRRTASLVGLVVFSHWLLDLIVHLPDLPLLFEGSPKVGLGLWGSGPGLIFSGVLEFVMLGIGIAIYLHWRKKNQPVIMASRSSG
jgi:membrane-bound metal-dependent hydrolase YbcI (DUF457 family)